MKRGIEPWEHERIREPRSAPEDRAEGSDRLRSIQPRPSHGEVRDGGARDPDDGDEERPYGRAGHVPPTGDADRDGDGKDAAKSTGRTPVPRAGEPAQPDGEDCRRRAHRE